MDGAWLHDLTTSHWVLVVDDNQLVRETVHENLIEFNYKVCSAATSDEALQHLAERRFDVLVVDLMMYPLTGDKLIELATQIQPHLRNIVISGYDQDTFDRFKFPKATVFLPKPFMGVDLDAVLKAVLNGEGVP